MKTFIGIVVAITLVAGGLWWAQHTGVGKEHMNPEAFNITPLFGSVPLIVQATTILDPGSYHIDFGDGEIVRANLYEKKVEQWSSKTYTTPGTYTVQLIQVAHCPSLESCVPVDNKIIKMHVINVNN